LAASASRKNILDFPVALASSAISKSSLFENHSVSNQQNDEGILQTTKTEQKIMALEIVRSKKMFIYYQTRLSGKIEIICLLSNIFTTRCGLSIK
jgi:hypothetical protein